MGFYKTSSNINIMLNIIQILILMKSIQNLYAYINCYNTFFNGDIKDDTPYEFILFLYILGTIIYSINVNYNVQNNKEYINYSPTMLIIVLLFNITLIIFFYGTLIINYVFYDKFTRYNANYINGNIPSIVYNYYNITDNSINCPTNTIMFLPEYNLTISKCEHNSMFYFIYNYKIENLPYYINKLKYIKLFLSLNISAIFFIIILEIILCYYIKRKIMHVDSVLV